MAGLVAGAAVVMAVLIVVPDALVTFRACKATDSTGAQLTCLSADQAVQAREAARSTAVQGLGGVAVLAAALAAAIVGLGQMRNTALVADSQRKHEVKLAAAERRHQRRGDTYPDMLRTAIASVEYYRIEILRTSPFVARDVTGAVVKHPELKGAPGPAELIAMDARVQAFGSADVAHTFSEFLKEGGQIERGLARWHTDQAMRRAMHPQTEAGFRAGAPVELPPVPPVPTLDQLEALRDALVEQTRAELASHTGDPTE